MNSTQTAAEAIAAANCSIKCRLVQLVGMTTIYHIMFYHVGKIVSADMVFIPHEVLVRDPENIGDADLWRVLAQLTYGDDEEERAKFYEPIGESGYSPAQMGWFKSADFDALQLDVFLHSH